jgi:hypothetical protein
MCRLLKKCVELAEVVYDGGGDGLVHLLVAPADTSVPYCLATGSAGGKDVLGEAVADNNHILCGDAESRNAELEDAGIGLADTDDASALDAAITPDVKAILVESPANLLLTVTDLAAADAPRVHQVESRHFCHARALG